MIVPGLLGSFSVVPRICAVYILLNIFSVVD